MQRGIGRLRAGGNSLFAQVAAMFAAGEQGAWFDPSDITSLFQDSAGTTPVTASGQPVGKILDKSGRGNHATQATAASRPIYNVVSGVSSVDFNGTNMSMATGSIAFSGTKMTVWTAILKSSDAAGAIFLESSANSQANAGAFGLFAPGTAAAEYYTVLSGVAEAEVKFLGFAAPITKVLCAQYDTTQATATVNQTLRVNGSAASGTAINTGNPASAAFTSQPLNIGARNGAAAFFNGKLYGLIVRGAQSSAAQVLQGEAYENARAGGLY